MYWAGNSVTLGVTGYVVFLWCRDMHSSYVFSIVLQFAYIQCYLPELYMAGGQRMLLFQ